MSEVTVLLAEVVRPVAADCRVRASVRPRAVVPVMEVVAALMVLCALVEALRTLVRVVGSVAVTAWCWGRVSLV